MTRSAFLCRFLLTGSALAMATAALAAPAGGSVAAGTATISSGGKSTTISQSSERAIINWTGFNVAADESVKFAQPDANAVTLNRVNSTDPSEIDGSITANGRIFIVNPNGVLFGAGARIDVGGLVATTADIANADFMAGHDRFNIASPKPQAAIVNLGHINIADTGLAALVAPSVANRGIITARLGTVTLGGHSTFTVDLAGDGLIAFDTGAAAPAPTSVRNDGTIVADGGSVRLDAGTASGLVGGVVDMSGVIEARGVGEKNGRVVLTGDSVTVGGTIDASASGSGDGGTVLVGGDRGGRGPDANARTTDILAGAKLVANGAGSGMGGNVVVWSDQATRMDGTISARGGTDGGAGGFVETSSHGLLSLAAGRVDASGPGGGGTWLLDPTDIIIGTTTSGRHLFGRDLHAQFRRQFRDRRCERHLGGAERRHQRHHLDDEQRHRQWRSHRGVPDQLYRQCERDADALTPIAISRSMRRSPVPISASLLTATRNMTIGAAVEANIASQFTAGGTLTLAPAAALIFDRGPDHRAQREPHRHRWLRPAERRHHLRRAGRQSAHLRRHDRAAGRIRLDLTARAPARARLTLSTPGSVGIGTGTGDDPAFARRR